MLVSSIIAVEYFYNSSLDLIISLGPIPCFHSVAIFYISEKKLLKKLQHLNVVDQEMLAMNDQKIPIYMEVWV